MEMLRVIITSHGTDSGVEKHRALFHRRETQPDSLRLLEEADECWKGHGAPYTHRWLFPELIHDSFPNNAAHRQRNCPSRRPRRRFTRRPEPRTAAEPPESHRSRLLPQNAAETPQQSPLRRREPVRFGVKRIAAGKAARFPHPAESPRGSLPTPASASLQQGKAGRFEMGMGSQTDRAGLVTKGSNARCVLPVNTLVPQGSPSHEKKNLPQMGGEGIGLYQTMQG